MQKLFQSFFVSVVFLTLALFASSVAQAQSSYTLNFDKASLKQLGLENINWVQYNGLVETKPNGDISVTFNNAADYLKWQEFGKTGKIPEPSNDGSFQMPNQEIGGIANVKGDSDTATPQVNQNQAPDISADFDNAVNNDQAQLDQELVQNDIDNMFAAEMAGVDVEIAKINDELYGGNATGSGLTGVCANAGNIFKQIACKVMIFLVDLRVLAYIISGFGMVMFAWAAIFNKISWKHFSQIAIGLFMLSMIGPFITYFTGYTDIEQNLEYGNYLGGSYTPIQGAAAAQCADGSSNCTPDTNTKTVNSKWSLKDLKGSIQSGLNLVRSGYNAYQGAKQVVQNVKTEAQNIGNAIKNSGGGLDGILDAASQVAGAANRLSFDVKTGVGGIASQVSNAANAAQDIAATNEQREERQNIRINGAQDGSKTTNAVSEWLSASGTGGQALGKVNQVTDTVGKAATGVGKATTAGHEGQKIGGNGGFGEVVGGIFAAGTAVGEGIGIYDEQTKAAQAAKAKEQQNLDNSKAIMNNAANTQLSKVNNSVGLTAQQNKTNAAVDSAVDTQIKNSGVSAAQASASNTTTKSAASTASNTAASSAPAASNTAVSTTPAASNTAASTTPASSSNTGTLATATQVANEQLKAKEASSTQTSSNTASSQASSTTNSSGYDVTTKSGGTTFMQDENGNMVAYDVQEQVFTNPTTGNSATVRGDGVIIYKTNFVGSGSVGGSAEYRIGKDGSAAVYYDGVYAGTYEADDPNLKIIMGNDLIQQAKGVNPDDLLKKQGS